MTWRVTHVDVYGHRHRLRVSAPTNRQAMAWAEQLFGEARALSCINLKGAKP